MALTKPVRKVAAERSAPPDDRMWTVAEVARYFQCTCKHVYKVLQYEIPGRKFGRAIRFDPRDVYVYAALLEKCGE